MTKPGVSSRPEQDNDDNHEDNNNNDDNDELGPLLSAEELRAERDRRNALRSVPFGILLGVVGVIGFVASFVLTIERIELADNPGYIPSCNFNPVLTCGPIMGSDQAAFFGFPNPIIGVATFPLLILVGGLLISRITLPRWVRSGLWLGTLGGFVFVHYLIVQSLTNLGAMCPYCIVVWVVTAPAFVYTTAYALQERALPAPAGLRRFVVHNRLLLLVLWYLALVVAAYFTCQSFWLTML